VEGRSVEGRVEERLGEVGRSWVDVVEQPPTGAAEGRKAAGEAR
jgi:hypothetical protein